MEDVIEVVHELHDVRSRSVAYNRLISKTTVGNSALLRIGELSREKLGVSQVRLSQPRILVTSGAVLTRKERPSTRSSTLDRGFDGRRNGPRNAAHFAHGADIGRRAAERLACAVGLVLEDRITFQEAEAFVAAFGAAPSAFLRLKVDLKARRLAKVSESREGARDGSELVLVMLRDDSLNMTTAAAYEAVDGFPLVI